MPASKKRTAGYCSFAITRPRTDGREGRSLRSLSRTPRKELERRTAASSSLACARRATSSATCTRPRRDHSRRASWQRSGAIAGSSTLRRLRGGVRSSATPSGRRRLSRTQATPVSAGSSCAARTATLCLPAGSRLARLPRASCDARPAVRQWFGPAAHPHPRRVALDSSAMKEGFRRKHARADLNLEA